jgi:hypothetical protein
MFATLEIRVARRRISQKMGYTTFPRGDKD